MGGTPLSAPRVPEVPGRRRAFEREGREIRPLAGPEIPISEPAEEEFEARFAAWHSAYNGSRPEFIAWEYLTLQKKQRNGLDFVYQYPIFGGRTRFGGYVLDFFFPLRNDGWRVQGLRWHRTTPQNRANDALSSVRLSGRGIRIIDLWEDDLLERPQYVLDLAWERGVSVQGRSFITEV